MPTHTAIWVGRQKNIAPKGLRGLYTVRAHHINVNFVTPPLFRSVKRMRKIAKLGRQRPSFGVLVAKKYSGLKKKYIIAGRGGHEKYELCGWSRWMDGVGSYSI